jgi:hypothetical protein
MELELIRVDHYGIKFDIFGHFLSHHKLLKRHKIFSGPKIMKKI